MDFSKYVKLQVYMVTLKDSADLDDFYTDMETPGGDLYIPDREVGVHNKREISRTTEYWLTEEESRFLKDDSRVAFVELNPKDRGIEVSEDVFLGKQSKVWQQALNRVHVQKSILLYCFGKLR